MPRFTVDPDISRARTPDTGLYTDLSIFDQAKEKWFARCWQFIGDASLAGEPGDAYPLVLLVYRPERSRDFTVQARWALYCENYLEGFHIPFVHSGLNAVIDFGNYTTELFRYSSLQLGIAKDDEDCFDLPAGSPDHGKKVAAYYFFIFPNMMFNFYPWGLASIL